MDRASRIPRLDGARGQILDGHPGDISNSAQVPRRHPAPLTDRRMADAAGASDADDHAALLQERSQGGISIHGVSMSDYPTDFKRNLQVPVGTSSFALGGIRRSLLAMPLSMDAIATRLRAVRAELGLSVPALAEKIGATKAALYKWEAGTRASRPNFPAEEAVAALCDLLPGLSMDYIYRGRVETMPPPLGIRLLAREVGMCPGEVGFDPVAARRAWASAIAEQAT